MENSKECTRIVQSFGFVLENGEVFFAIAQEGFAVRRFKNFATEDSDKVMPIGSRFAQDRQLDWLFLSSTKIVLAPVRVARRAKSSFTI